MVTKAAAAKPVHEWLVQEISNNSFQLNSMEMLDGLQILAGWLPGQNVKKGSPTSPSSLHGMLNQFCLNRKGRFMQGLEIVGCSGE